MSHPNLQSNPNVLHTPASSWPSRDELLRQLALTEATKTIGYGTPRENTVAEQVVSRAQTYLDFLTGTEKQPGQGFGERLSAQSISVHAHREGYNQAIADVLALKDRHGLHHADTVNVEQAWNAIHRLRKN